MLYMPSFQKFIGISDSRSYGLFQDHLKITDVEDLTKIKTHIIETFKKQQTQNYKNQILFMNIWMQYPVSDNPGTYGGWNYQMISFNDMDDTDREKYIEEMQNPIDVLPVLEAHKNLVVVLSNIAFKDQ